jgi:hypothetical protein
MIPTPETYTAQVDLMIRQIEELIETWYTERMIREVVKENIKELLF